MRHWNETLVIQFKNKLTGATIHNGQGLLGRYLNNTENLHYYKSVPAHKAKAEQLQIEVDANEQQMRKFIYTGIL